MNATVNNSLLNEVFFDAWIFEDTIFNNIRFGCITASDEEVLEAAERAGVLSFAWNFREGLHTVVKGEQIVLTTVQKLRISLARALLRKQQIVFARDTDHYALLDQLLQKDVVLIVADDTAIVKGDDIVLVLE